MYTHDMHMTCTCYTRDLHWLSHTNPVYIRSLRIFPSSRQNFIRIAHHNLRSSPLLHICYTYLHVLSYLDPREQGIPAIQLGPLRFPLGLTGVLLDIEIQFSFLGEVDADDIYLGTGVQSNLNVFGLLVVVD